MATAADVCNEFNEMSALIASRSGPGAARLKASSLTSLTGKISRIQGFTAATALVLQTGLSESSIPADMIDAIEEAIDARLAEPVGPASNRGDDKKGSKLEYILNYLSKEDWVRLGDPV